MDGLDDMTVFKATVDHGSASAAGRHLGMPKSTVARRILELETRLGTPLFHRGRQHYVLTSFGKDCYQQCARVVIEAEKVFAMADRQRGTPTGSLHVICPPLIGEMLIDQLAAEFVIAEPHVRLHLDAGMTVFDPRPASADLIIYPTFEPLPNSDVIARRIFTNEYVLAASPQFLDGRSLRDPQALKSFECLGLGSPASEWVWRLKRGREAALHRFTPRFTTTQLSALRQAVRSGLGIAALPTAICTGDFRSGRLVRVLNDWTPAPVTFYAVYPSAGTLSLAARRFLNLVVRRLRAAYQSV